MDVTRLSIIIPAFNEAKYVEACIGSLRRALEAHADRLAKHEIVVCDNNSTDETAAIARRCGARIVFEPHNQISRARNTGAKEAGGDWLLFVDADSTVHPETIGDMLDHIESGRYVGGGCDLQLDGGTRIAHVIGRFAVAIFRTLKMAGGSFLFCRAEAFREVGGFSEEIYAGEEVFLSRALKRWARPRGLRFAFLTKRAIVTSARKLESHGLGAFLRLALRGMIFPCSTLRSRKHLGFFYDGRR
jgi:glycosyltransferase involved in cell wall biosynthesis